MAQWLYSVDSDGLLVTPAFMDRLRSCDTSALRALKKLDLTALYRRGYTKITRAQKTLGLFWQENPPPLARIPFARGPHSPAPSIPDYVVLQSEVTSKRRLRDAFSYAKLVDTHHRSKGPGHYVHIVARGSPRRATGTAMKPNPKFELVVVNKYDRDALLKLLAATDGESSNVEKWLAKRTKAEGATQADVLYADYEAWCKQRGEAYTGTKSFSQALVAARVVKLKRGKGGSRYALSLRPA